MATSREMTMRTTRRLGRPACALLASVALFHCADGPPFVTASSGTGGGPDATAADERDNTPIILPDPNPPAGDGASDDAGDASIEAGGDAAIDGTADVLPDAFVCNASKDPKDEPCVIDESYGVFVATVGGDTSAGTRMDPVRTIAEGIAMAVQKKKPRVYVCKGNYSEQVVLDAQHDGISIFGGLDCINGWTWTGAMAVVTGPSALYALRVDSTTRVITVEDVSFVVPDASGQDSAGAGNSSIAAFIHAAIVNLRRVALTAGSGAGGAAGASGGSAPNYSVSQPIGPGGTSYDSATAAPGVGGVNLCLVTGSSRGGAGGAAGDIPNTTNTYPGGSGTPIPQPPPPPPHDGAGGQSIPDTGAGCSPMSNGDPGANGAAGTGGSSANDLGALSAAGWEPSGGTDGQTGNPGQGGGGGAGGGIAVAGPVGGGGGGAGGCGGSGGKGGRGGGASIAVISLQAVATLAECALTTSAAGNGGSGGPGQRGQRGGPGTTGNACTGSFGGWGAGGSGGAGGTGGISVGIAYHGGGPSYDSATSFTVGASGHEGSPGAGASNSTIKSGPLGTDGNPGAAGLAGTAQPMLSL
jgi:hypothetical protein